MKQNKPRSGAEKLKDSLVEDVQKFVHDHPTNHGIETDLSEKTIFVDFEQHKVIMPPPPPEEDLKNSQASINQGITAHPTPQESIIDPVIIKNTPDTKKEKTKIQFFDVEEPIDDFDSHISEYQAENDPLNLPKAALHDAEPDYMADLFPDEKTQVIATEVLDKTVVLNSVQKKSSQSQSKIELYEPQIPINKSTNIQLGSVSVFAGADALKLAQEKIKNLESEVDRLRADNDELSSSADVIKQKVIEYRNELQKVENDKANLEEILNSEIHILKSNLQFRDQETSKFQQEIETLKARLKSDFKKIRVRERELENRLELLRVEKATLLKTKDEQILDLKRKIDQLQMENDNYRQKCIELNRTLEGNQDQFKRTVRALRLALTNLESKDPGSIKKAE